MAGAEVEDVAGAAPIGEARTEHFAALEPADEHGFERLGDAERLAIHLFHFELEIGRQALGDRMAGGGDPDPLALARLAPVQGAGGAHQALEDLGEVGRVQQDDAHALPDALGDALDDFVGDVAMGGMAPPDQHVGFGQRLDGAAVLGLLQGGGFGHDIAVAGKEPGNLVVHAVGIVVGDDPVLLLVNVLAPHQGTDRHQ